MSSKLTALAWVAAASVPTGGFRGKTVEEFVANYGYLVDRIFQARPIEIAQLTAMEKNRKSVLLIA